ncbi:hypothetical protein ElyMa_002341300 [Elysia marginata]|uniref:Uncharacterized protein n=1 Tax=Elysia marginata TaxID=1093978 RepID=A0AAV4G7H1_9GAST|nr:hypothetical protein ElyMa_002341300 [Elysia marginata]
MHHKGRGKLKLKRKLSGIGREETLVTAERIPHTGQETSKTNSSATVGKVLTCNQVTSKKAERKRKRRVWGNYITSTQTDISEACELASDKKPEQPIKSTPGHHKIVKGE